MTYQPVLPSGGLAGWRFLQRTIETQQATFNKSVVMTRETERFAERIADIRSAADLVADRDVLKVALGAFGLGDDLSNKFFIQKILEEGTTKDDALANKLADSRYERLSAAFGFGPGETVQTGSRVNMARIVEAYREQQFEIAIGNQDESMRLALNAERELERLAGDPRGDDAKWFTLMSLPPVRKVLETAFGLPSAFGQIDIDQQLGVLKDKTLSLTGRNDVAQFLDADNREKLITRFQALAQINAFASVSSPQMNALTLLRS
jgi:hypothetical protein